MQKEDIRIRHVIVHILDSTVGLPVLSDSEIEFGSDFAEFLREHIYRIIAGDDSKDCEFYKEQSEIYHMLTEYADENFVDMSKADKIKKPVYEELLYSLMNAEYYDEYINDQSIEYEKRYATYEDNKKIVELDDENITNSMVECIKNTNVKRETDIVV